MRPIAISVLFILSQAATAQPPLKSAISGNAVNKPSSTTASDTSKAKQPELQKPLPATDSTDAQLDQIREDLHALRTEKKSWSSPDVLLPVLGTLLGAAAGGVFALLQLIRTNKHQRLLADDAAKNARALADDAAKHERLLADGNAKQAAADRHRDRLFEGLKWFEGNSQPRSIGIALIEANWFTWPDLQPTWTTVIANQAVHLLTGTEKRDSRVEFTNLVRIIDLLQRPATQAGGGRAFDAYLSDEQQGQVRGALGEAITTSNDPNATRGLAVETNTLTHWKLALGKPPTASR